MLFLQYKLGDSFLQLNFLLSAASLQMGFEDLIVLGGSIVAGVVGEEGYIDSLVQRDNGFYVGVDLGGVLQVVDLGHAELHY